MTLDDLVGLILRDHARIVRLFGDLEGAADSPVRLATLWTELCEVLLAHLGAFEEISFLPLLCAAPDRSMSTRDLRAQKLDTLDAVAEARLQQVGSPLWWLAVRAARTATDRHISCVETDWLPHFGQQTPERTKAALGYQWERFVADLGRDRHGGTTSD